jgi:hypothetical protein
MTNEEIDRLFRALFVYSIGFFQLISRTLEHNEEKYPILAGVWKVFAILLEYCCQLDYKLTITTLNIENRDEIDRIEAHWTKEL